MSSPIPFISISPPPQEDPIVEPFSPFSALPVPPPDRNGFRPSHLTPPTSLTSFKRPFSPLHPVPAAGQGLESQRFRDLLAASKHRNVSGGSNQSVEFRREVAMNAHKNKHSERRALFLSKLQAPPSPTAMMTPITPESPSIFHYSHPSPGLESPLTLFESWSDNHANDLPHTWVECVDFRLMDEQSKLKPSLNCSSTIPTHGVPSLDQISARLVPRTAKLDDVKVTCDAPADEDMPRPSVGIGRLRMPLRTQAILQSNNQQTKSTPSRPVPLLSPAPCPQTFTVSPPRSSTTAQLTESNLNSLNSRDQKASNMLFTIRRRTMSEFKSTGVQEEEVPSKLRWRRSAPADMTPLQARSGFKHPVLALSGGF